MDTFIQEVAFVRKNIVLRHSRTVLVQEACGLVDVVLVAEVDAVVEHGHLVHHHHTASRQNQTWRSNINIMYNLILHAFLIHSVKLL